MREQIRTTKSNSARLDSQLNTTPIAARSQAALRAAMSGFMTAACCRCQPAPAGAFVYARQDRGQREAAGGCRPLSAANDGPDAAGDCTDRMA